MVETFDDLVNEDREQKTYQQKEKKQTVADRAKAYAQQRYQQWQAERAQRAQIKNSAREQYKRDVKTAREEALRARLKHQYGQQVKNARSREYQGNINYYGQKVFSNPIFNQPIARKSSQDVIGMSIGQKSMFNSFTSGQNIAGLTGFGGMNMYGKSQRKRPAIRTETVTINGKSYTRRIKSKPRPVRRNKFTMW